MSLWDPEAAGNAACFLRLTDIQMLEIRNFAENETERKFLLKQLVTRSAVLPSWPKSKLPVLPTAHLSKASENLTSLNKNGTRFKGWSKLLQD